METRGVAPTKKEYCRLAGESTHAAPRIPIELTVEVNDPFLAYLRARNPTGGFFLETSGGQSGWGYFGIEPVARLQVAREVSSLAALPHGPSLAELDAWIEPNVLLRGECSVPYPCGIVGLFSYDLVREFEALPEGNEKPHRVPQLAVGVFDSLVAWRTPITESSVTLHVTVCPAITTDCAETYERGREEARAIAARIQSGPPGTNPAAPHHDQPEFSVGCDIETYRERVRTVKQYIRDGDTFQANISHELTTPARSHPTEVFQAIREHNPAPYSALLEYPAVDLISASPELLFETDGTTIRTEPIAGTRPRGDTPEADRMNERDLRTDEKERAEHAMLVDLERNDIGKIAAVGSVTVDEYRRIDRYASVMHLVSEITGTLPPDTRLVDIIASLFPGGTITGAPKPRTMEIIDEIEQTPRGPYTGSVGIIGFDGRATFNILIRTIARINEQYSLRVGGGVVHDSDPDEEYQETLAKATGVLDSFSSLTKTGDSPGNQCC